MNVAIQEICRSHKIDKSFLNELIEYGLVSAEDEEYIPSDQLEMIEKFIHFHYELNINLEGIEAINHLLQKINTLHAEIQNLKNRLRVYEGDI